MALSSRNLVSRLCRPTKIQLNSQATHWHYPRLGKRERVGYGKNGNNVYEDDVAFPMQSIRFKEPDANINCLRAKEQLSWGKLSRDEKKALYRYSFCQTFCEMKQFTGQHKLIIGLNLWVITFGIWLYILVHINLHAPLPETFDDEHQKAQLKRMLTLHVNPILGISTKWDYENNKWK